MTEECLICGAPLEYLEQDVLMECSVCHKKEWSKTRCVNGHYVCNACHMHGPEHHILVGSALLTAYKNAGGELDFKAALAGKQFGLSNQMTSLALEQIGKVGGPRCCKRDSYLSVLAAVDFTAKNLGVEMDRAHVVCSRSSQNRQCLGTKCPFHKQPCRN